MRVKNCRKTVGNQFLPRGIEISRKALWAQGHPSRTLPLWPRPPPNISPQTPLFRPDLDLKYPFSGLQSGANLVGGETFTGLGWACRSFRLYTNPPPRFPCPWHKTFYRELGGGGVCFEPSHGRDCTPPSLSGPYRAMRAAMRCEWRRVLDTEK